MSFFEERVYLCDRLEATLEQNRNYGNLLLTRILFNICKRCERVVAVPQRKGIKGFVLWNGVICNAVYAVDVLSVEGTGPGR